MAVKPLSPDEALQKKIISIPDEIIEAVNEFLIQNAHESSITIKQDEILELALEKFAITQPNITRELIFKNKWMDFEDSFRKSGWNVLYDKPGYSESYSAYFKFTKK